MLFTNPNFALFFLVCFSVRWLLPRYTWQKYFLLICNAVFYGAWDYRFLFLMGGYILFNHMVAWSIFQTSEHNPRRTWLWLSVTVNLAVLGFFKYYNFFVESATTGMAKLGVTLDWTTMEIILPVGISFITFQAMSYVIDVYRRELEPASLLDFAVYKSFFPQLVAGPIVRASNFLPQLVTPRRIRDVDFRGCLLLFLIGYFKKMCVADNIAGLIDPIFAEPATQHGSDVLLAAIGYSVQIYCDFSGYTDMAIACAGLLGFHLTLNFDAPYLSGSIQEFWRRWHISLSSWLRDYLYISLGGSRKGRFRTYLNLMITMALGGLWHGANWTFVLWGVAHGTALCVHRLASAIPKPAMPRFARPPFLLIGWALTLAWVVACFALFRCDSLDTFFKLVWRLPVQTGEPALSQRLWWLLLLLCTLHAGGYFLRPVLSKPLRAVPTPVYAMLLGIAVSVALFFTPITTVPFIYFQF
jgi:alginate O-acetyltransferase complex protein AlgI